MSIYRKAVDNPVTTALVFIACMVFGVYSLINTSIAQFPEFDANVIMVMSSYQGANASDIENNLTKTLENALNGVEDLKNLTSNSKENISLLTLEFEYGTDIEEERRLLYVAVTRAKDRLYISFPKYNDKSSTANDVSRFIREAFLYTKNTAAYAVHERG